MLDQVFAKDKLRGLKMRVHPEIAAQCVLRLRDGESIYQLYAGKNAVVSQGLAEKLSRLDKAGELEFLVPDADGRVETHLVDPLSVRRYQVVKRAEELAPHRLWTLKHLRTSGKWSSRSMRDAEARDLLAEYDLLRHRRNDAERFVDDSAGNDTVVPRMLGRFRSFTRYITLLYEMYYRTEYADAPAEWVRCAASIRVRGELDEDRDRVDAAEDLMRYEIWANADNRSAYFASLRRLKPSPKSYNAFVRNIENDLEHNQALP
ncbi:MAG: hypothetical protein FI725_05645 [SAR202 cluster bacterium]|nr:hypothetical protein [SAR202 cluster bacterium]|tara:strand:- start:3292 stop:4077 length:786 start_codon:yes stop_codon:yes gene_type:complete